MTVGAAFLLHFLVIFLTTCAALIVLASVACLVWALWTLMIHLARPDRRPYSTLDLIGEDLSRLDRLDRLGRELR